jgi:hypothetical protein
VWWLLLGLIVCDVPDEVVGLSNSWIEISLEHNSEVQQAKDMHYAH